jgi:kinesin family protein C2/C3
VDVFSHVQPFVDSALDGLNVTVFAFGQTGAGKTFTMSGDSENLGYVSHTLLLVRRTDRLLSQHHPALDRLAV